MTAAIAAGLDASCAPATCSLWPARDTNKARRSRAKRAPFDDASVTAPIGRRRRLNGGICFQADESAACRRAALCSRPFHADGVSIDTRTMKRGRDVRGAAYAENGDGHAHFVTEALHRQRCRGCAWCIDQEGLPDGAPLLVVADTQDGAKRASAPLRVTRFRGFGHRRLPAA